MKTSQVSLCISPGGSERGWEDGDTVHESRVMMQHCYKLKIQNKHIVHVVAFSHTIMHASLMYCTAGFLASEITS